MSGLPFSEQALLPHLPDPNRPVTWWVAYSGGLDSHVLLYALQRLLSARPGAVRLRAIHVHHGISANADAWLAHCEARCRELGVDFSARRVVLPDTPGESLETRARHARYEVFSSVLGDGDVLFQAHHQDDQLETLLYRLRRGSAPRGLAGIPARRALGRGELRRPLLDFPRGELLDYARRAGLRWIEDESNADERFDRNFLRHRVLPLLEERWPGLRAGWQRSMAHCGEAALLLDELAEQDLAAARTGCANVIDTAPLHALSEARQRNVLRRWFDELRRDYGLPPPDYHSLRRMAGEVLPAAADAVPLVSWRGEGGRVDLRRYRGRLYALRPLEPRPVDEILEWTSLSAFAVSAPLALGPGLGSLHLEPVATGGFPLGEALPLRVRFGGGGGERVKAAGRRTRPLRKILQEQGVPPWLRAHLPLVYAGDELLGVADLFLCDSWARGGADLYRIRWERPLIHCGY